MCIHCYLNTRKIFLIKTNTKDKANTRDVVKKIKSIKYYVRF